MKVFILLMLVFLIESVSAAHFIIGVVGDARDGTLAEDREVVLWNPANGIDDNLTDIIGVNGNSGADNIYMIDCELLQTACQVGNEIRVQVINETGEYITDFVNLTVTGEGYNLFSNLTLNSPPNITSLIFDDSLTVPAGEIDLLAGNTREVTCSIIVDELDNQDLQNPTSEIYHFSASYGAPDDNNNHSTNNTCYIDSGYGNENESQVNCSFSVWYYANPGQWTCEISIEDNLSAVSNSSAQSNVNTLLSVGVIDSLDFGIINMTNVSGETLMNITNYGNVEINISLYGYAMYEYDNLSMNCSGGSFGNISIDYEKYNLTDSNSGELNLTEFEASYTNLTGSPEVKEFNLDYNQNDTDNEAFNFTYWRVYIPEGVAGGCSGKVIIAATQAAGS